VNTTYQAALWADALFAMDRQWWKRYLPDVTSRFEGQRYSCNNCAGVRQVKIKAHGNSGAGAIALAVAARAERIVLLGYDCQYSSTGKRHWHGDHPKGFGNAGKVGDWPAAFGRLATELPHQVEVLNASRETALECWPRVTLDDALCR
jgi:hypothetical protein